VRLEQLAFNLDGLRVDQNQGDAARLVARPYIRVPPVVVEA
jgi:hypothetical protein